MRGGRGDEVVEERGMEEVPPGLRLALGPLQMLGLLRPVDGMLVVTCWQGSSRGGQLRADGAARQAEGREQGQEAVAAPERR